MVSYLDKVAGTIEYRCWENFQKVSGAREAVERAQWSFERLQQEAYHIHTKEYKDGTIEKLRNRAEVRRTKMSSLKRTMSRNKLRAW